MAQRHQHQPEGNPFEQGRVFDLQRDADQRHHAKPAAHQPGARALGCHPAQHQPGQRHGQVEEHRRLTAIALIARQAEQIGHASPEGAPWPGDHARHAIDRQRGGRREEHGHHLILHHAQSAQQPDRRIEDEQAHRLAVPDVHIGHRAMQHPVADQQIELLVDVQHGIAESGAANQQGGQQQARHGTQHFPRESAGAGVVMQVKSG
jgi:hypothetical protein